MKHNTAVFNKVVAGLGKVGWELARFEWHGKGANCSVASNATNIAELVGFVNTMRDAPVTAQVLSVTFMKKPKAREGVLFELRPTGWVCTCATPHIQKAVLVMLGKFAE